MFKCNICNITLSLKRNLIRHIKSHDGNKFICSICSKVFTRKDNLNIHIEKTHVKNSKVNTFNLSAKLINKNDVVVKHKIKNKMIFKSMFDINHTFNSTNAYSNSVLNEVAKAKENIKRKFNLSKNYEANTQSLVEHTLKPIKYPLIEISNKNINMIDTIIEKYDTIEPKIKNYNTIESKIEEGSFKFKKEEETYNPYEKQKQSWFNKWYRASDIDRIYGPKELSNGQIKLGEKELIFDGNMLIIEDNSYSLTQGLEQLLFSKNPKLYTRQDLESYKQILIQTSAHLTAAGSRIRKGGSKYRTIIQQLFLSDEGVKYDSFKLRKRDLVDPNKLIDRLRLLILYQDVGNTSVSSEISMIFEELYEAGIIKRIPKIKT